MVIVYTIGEVRKNEVSKNTYETAKKQFLAITKKIIHKKINKQVKISKFSNISHTDRLKNLNTNNTNSIFVKETTKVKIKNIITNLKNEHTEHNYVKFTNIFKKIVKEIKK